MSLLVSSSSDDGFAHALRSRSGVVGRLLRESYRFDFFQSVYLITRMFPDAPEPGETTGFFDEPVRLRPSSALVFPASDVKNVDIVTREDADPLIYVTSTFMGLYGVDASLPSHFHDVIEREPEDTEALRAFLDIFNHRIYAFFYRAWKKYRPSLRRPRHSKERSRDARRFLSLAGLSNVPNLSDAPVAPMRLASFAGRLGSRARNAEGLAALLGGLLDGIPVEVEENVPRWIPMANRPGMGEGGGIQLGVNSSIGETVYDRSSKFQVKLGPVGLDTYLSLLPGGELAEKVAWLIRLYAPDHLDYDIELTLDAEDVSGITLGDNGRLGLSTFLGDTAPSMTRVVEYDTEDAPADDRPTRPSHETSMAGRAALGTL